MRLTRRTGAVVGGILASALALASVGGTSVAAAQAGMKHGGTVTYVVSPSEPWVRNFNPYSPNSMYGYILMDLYEPLLYFDQLTGQIIPWLASSYRWSHGNTVLTVTVRKGVQWSDGQPFTPADVVFTYNMLKKYPAMDTNSLWSVLSSVTAQGQDVVFRLKRADNPIFWYLAGMTPIVPAHIWSKIKNPVTWPDPNPVTTGPFLVKHVDPNLMVFVRNPHYWQAGKPYINEIRIPMYLSNNTADLQLSKGNFSYSTNFVPDIQSAFVAKDPKHFHYWFPNQSTLVLAVNDAIAPFSNYKFRQALSYAINRQQVSAIGEYGYEPVANTLGILQPEFNQYLDKTLLRQYSYPYNPRKALAILRSIGYHLQSGTLIAPDGKPVNLTLNALSGATDWVASSEIIARQLKQIGIDVRVAILSPADYWSSMSSGKFQMAIDWPLEGPLTPYYWYNSLLNSAFTAPVGKTASSNVERWMDKRTDALLADYASNLSAAARIRDIHQLEAIVGKYQPVIPLMYGVAWYEYNTTTLTGWPTPQNPYCMLATPMDSEYMLLHVHLK